LAFAQLLGALIPWNRVARFWISSLARRRHLCIWAASATAAQRQSRATSTLLVIIAALIACSPCSSGQYAGPQGGSTAAVGPEDTSIGAARSRWALERRIFVRGRLSIGSLMANFLHQDDVSQSLWREAGSS
jgi:hypothetical protein